MPALKQFIRNFLRVSQTINSRYSNDVWPQLRIHPRRPQVLACIGRFGYYTYFDYFE